MSKDRIICSVSFSTDDPFEMLLLHHCKQFGKFSKYMKRLIQRDMEAGENITVQPIPPIRSVTAEQVATQPIDIEIVPISQIKNPPVISQEEDTEELGSFL